VTPIIEQLTAWLAEHTYAVVFVSSLIDATAIPFPGRIVLAAAGAFAATGDASALLIVAFGAAGIVITDHVWYFARPLSSQRLLRLYCRLTFSSPDCVERATDWFKRFGTLTIVVGRFVAAVRVLAWPVARDHGVGYATFLALEVPTALVWTAIWVTLGWLLGEHWRQASTEARWLSLALGSAVVAAFVVFRGWRRLRAGRGAATAPTESAASASPESLADPRARPRP
jgi:membrane protein DedA with SNARE-associated domain